MNLAQIIERAEKEYGGLTDELGLDIELEWGLQSRQHQDFVKIESFLSEKIKEAYEAGRAEEHAFFNNILDGVDIADKQMGNEGGGTKAIRFALQTRVINQ